MVSLVFVHIGTKHPRYLLKNIERTRQLFHDRRIILISDQEPNLKWMQENNIDFLRHKIQDRFDSIFSFGDFEEGFRGGYWRHTLERLLTLESFHEVFPNEKLLHIESDVILFPNFPFEEVETLDKIAWLNFSAVADIASLVYSPAYAASKKFSDQIIQDFSNFGGSDMDVLHRIRKKDYGYILLPTLNKNLIQYANIYADKKYILEICGNSNQTEHGIYDALGIGMWLSGIDPRNKFGVTKVHSREFIDSGIVVVDPSRMKFEFTSEGNFYVNSGSGLIPIYNLHIHSKDRHLLSVNWKRRMGFFVNNRDTRPKVIGFNPKIFVSLVVTNIKNGTLIPFLSHFPGIRNLKAKFSTSHVQ